MSPTSSTEEISSMSNSSSGHVPATALEEAAPSDGARLRKVISIQDQSSLIPPKKLFVVTLSLIFTIFLSAFEMVSVSTTLPGIARDFGTTTDISWVGTAFLVANTSSQVIYSRLSDIFGRKILLVIAIGVFTVGNLLCGFSRNMAQLIAFRVIAGLGGGGIGVLVLIIISDISTLRTRGKMVAYVGVGVAAGSAVGPLLGGVFTQQASWRWVFWVTVPVSALAMIQIIFFLPLKPVTGSFKSKLKKVDFLGSILMLISTIFILVPISSGGSTFPWSSPVIIVLLVLGGVTLVLFFFVEWRYAALPIIPLHLLSQRSLAAISAITFLAGCYYYANVYFLPIYFQILLEPPTGALLSSAMLQSLLLPQIATSLAAGFLVQKLGHYNPVLWFGYAVWVIGAGVQTTFARSTTHAYIVGILFVEGFGVGWTLQTALVAAQAIAPAKDRAVVTGMRNLFRYTGGSFGLAISSAIMNNIINSKLATSDLPKTIVDQINGAEFNVPAGLTAAQSQTLLDAEMEGVKGVFWFLLAVSLLTFLLSLIVEDHGLPEDKKKSDEKEETRQENVETQAEGETVIQGEEGTGEKTLDLDGQR